MTKEDTIMENFTFRDLTQGVAKVTGSTYEDAHAAAHATLDQIGRALAEGKYVRLNNFGSFEVRDVPVNLPTVEPGTVVRRVRFIVTGTLRKAVQTGVPFTTSRRRAKSTVSR